jgi:tetratricopeptide (TPR) repeat protein
MAERDWSGVITSTTEGLSYYPYDPELLCLQGYALRKTGHYQESVDLITIAIPNDTRPVRYANRGYGFLAMGKAQDALNDADSALTLDASYATAYALKASALRMKGNLSLALETIEKAIAIEPHNAYYLHLEGRILDDMGNCAGADTAYRNSITINPDYDLPYPGLSNATVDLEKSAARCKDQGARIPPTKSVFPAAPVLIALIIFFVYVTLGPQKLE